MAVATKTLSSGQKAAQTRKRRAAGRKAAATRKRRATAAKAAATLRRTKPVNEIGLGNLSDA